MIIPFLTPMMADAQLSHTKGIGVDQELTIVVASDPPYPEGSSYRLIFTARNLTEPGTVDFFPIETARGFPATLFRLGQSNCPVFFIRLPFGLNYWQVVIPAPEPGSPTSCDVEFIVNSPQPLLIPWFLVNATDPDQSNNRVDVLFDPNGAPPTTRAIPSITAGGVLILAALMILLAAFRLIPRVRSNC